MLYLGLGSLRVLATPTVLGGPLLRTLSHSSMSSLVTEVLWPLVLVSLSVILNLRKYLIFAIIFYRYRVVKERECLI